VVICDFDIVDMAFLPSETNPILLIDADAVLMLPISFEAFQSISRRHVKFVDLPNPVDLIQFPAGHRPHRAGAAPSSCLGCYTIKNILCTSGAEGSYHGL
jgi:hypothetical protein